MAPMTVWTPNRVRRAIERPFKILNKTFYKFLFSFIAVVAGVLLFILMLGVSSGVQ